MKLRTVSALVVAAFVGGAAAASAAQPWHVFARGTDSSDYGPYASAHADAPKSAALAVRAVSSTGKPAKVTFTIFCAGEAELASGSVFVASVSNSKKCSLSGDGFVDGAGTVRIELLRR